jgi:hypothetical protein
MPNELQVQVLIVGASTGGVAAALAAASLGVTVILTEPTQWIGGQLTSQAVPPDEHPWIEKFGCTGRYRAFRNGVRQRYRDHRPLTGEARANPFLNPGGGIVSQISHEFPVGLAVLEAMLQPYTATGQVKILLRTEPVAADVEGDRVRAVTVRSLESGHETVISADYVLDATELGDVLPLAGCEYVSGAESKAQTGEPHALDAADPNCVQGFTWCFPLARDPTPGAEHVIDRPEQYDRWRSYVPTLTPPWPGPMLSWTYAEPYTCRPVERRLFSPDPNAFSFWRYRQIARSDIYAANAPHELTLVNWPQNDYWEQNVIDQPEAVVAARLEESRQLSLSLLYWLQTEAPRHDGGNGGYPNLYLVPNLVGTRDGLAMAPYFRESRRIQAMFTVTENHVGSSARFGEELDATKLTPTQTAEIFHDSVGVGYYRIDLHPTASGRNYLDVASLPFQIPLGSLIPQRMTNLLPACKNLGVTHITNGCFRLHPVEWNVGEAAGLLAGYCLRAHRSPHQVLAGRAHLAEFQSLLNSQGIELNWPSALYR